jgi:hypothetical protein
MGERSLHWCDPKANWPHCWQDQRSAGQPKYSRRFWSYGAEPLVAEMGLRLPVGSSATMISGRFDKARAIATRWRWPEARRPSARRGNRCLTGERCAVCPAAQASCPAVQIWGGRNGLNHESWRNKHKSAARSDSHVRKGATGSELRAGAASVSAILPSTM